MRCSLKYGKLVESESKGGYIGKQNQIHKNPISCTSVPCKSYWHGTTQSKTPEITIPGQFPLFIEKSKGAYLWDIDGNRYTDYIMGYGAISLGYCIDEVDEAAIARSETAL